MSRAYSYNRAINNVKREREPSKKPTFSPNLLDEIVSALTRFEIITKAKNGRYELAPDFENTLFQRLVDTINAKIIAEQKPKPKVEFYEFRLRQLPELR